MHIFCKCEHEDCIVHAGSQCDNIAQSNLLCSNCNEVFSLWEQFSDEDLQ